MDRSYASTTASAKAERARIELLSDLHRPLEDHWAGNKAGLDANSSDYVYKHHITRLEGIYNSTEICVDNKAPIGPANVSPGSLLYGKSGILVGEERTYKTNTKREKNWDPHHNVIETMHACYERRSGLNDRAETVSRSVSPTRPDYLYTSRAGPGRDDDGGGRGGSPVSARAGAGVQVRGRSRDSSSSSSPSHRHSTAYASPRDNINNRRMLATATAPPLTQPTGSTHGGPGRPPLQPTAARASPQQQQQQQHHQHQQHRYAQGEAAEDESTARSTDADAGGSTRYRCDDPSVLAEELLLAGLYQLTPQQRHAYQLFVSMLVEHDTTDQLRIIEGKLA